jgi:hypothetical protein
MRNVAARAPLVLMAHRLRGMGWSTRRIAKAIGIDHVTIVNYLNSTPQGGGIPPP